MDDVLIKPTWGMQGMILDALLAGPRTKDDLIDLIYGPHRVPLRSGYYPIYRAGSEWRKKRRPGWRIPSEPIRELRYGQPRRNYILRRA